MKITRKKHFTATVCATAVASIFLLGADLSEARKAGPAFRAVRAMRAPAVTAQQFGGTTRHVSEKPAFSGVDAPRIRSFSTMPHSNPTQPTTRAGTLFPEVSVGETSRVPLDRQPDPSDIMKGLEDTLHFPGYELVDEKYRGGPDRERPYGLAEEAAYEAANEITDVSQYSCGWTKYDEIKAANWGGTQGNPLIGDSTGVCNDLINDGNKGTEGKDTGGKVTSHKENDTEGKTEKPTDTETENSVVEEKKDNDNGGEGDDGNDPDEMRSLARAEISRSSVNEALVAEVTEAMDMVSRDGSRGGNLGDYGNFGFNPSGTNTRRGVAPDPDTFGPPAENRPDVAENPVSSRVMANPMGYVASPAIGDDSGPVDPNPGPTAGSAAAALSASGGATMANPMGNAMSPAIGDDGGKDPNPPPGPEQ